ncbi:Hint domain-containing protein [Lichenicola sp.]|uniref:Hint domain-containing protein n=1 Tax=Lichenicola sp. TaxID=2804529 RepID=UPI003AFF9692
MSDSTTEVFVPGDLVISVYGDGANTGTYTDNAAAPIVLEQITTAGTFVSQMELPQTTTVVNGVTENAISGEYGSSSEGSLELAANGQSLVLAGYGINANTYNAGGAAVYGNNALAQSTSIQGGGYTAVSRVIADINADGTVDTSTALYNVFNTNNPRSVATVDGSTFYISGQGVKGDATQGVFEAKDGASSATVIDGSTDTRTLEIYDGELYVSRDSKQGSGGTSNISSYGTSLPNSATTPIPLSGIMTSVKLTAAEENSVNGSAVGTKVALSPENYFFANATTLYVADSGNPKEATLGDGGLQKWIFNGSSWKLAYTLSAGLNLVPNTASAGTTGLIGLTGTVEANGTVQLYATNATIGDLDQTYLYGITDTLGATTNPGESFTTLVTAAPDTNIRGVSFAPVAADLACFCRGTRILTERGELAVESLQEGDIALTLAGGTMVPARIVWIGQRRIDLERHPTPAMVRPIRFAPDSLGDGQPSRPLLLSPDHAVLLDGVLVAARQLVNGGSITIETPASVQYFHVELEHHAILLADGAAAESYRDTGNRAQFATSGAVTALHPDFTGSATPPTCAPLITEGAFVQPIWQRLSDRAASLGLAARIPVGDKDARLALVLADGQVLQPAERRADGLHVFWLDGAETVAQTVRLRSRHASVADVQPWQDDRRQLGVAIGAIEIWRRQDGLSATSVPLDSDALSGGWWAGETDGGRHWRWTDGNAGLTLPAGLMQLAVRVEATSTYLPDATESIQPAHARAA